LGGFACDDTQMKHKPSKQVTVIQKLLDCCETLRYASPVVCVHARTLADPHPARSYSIRYLEHKKRDTMMMNPCTREAKHRMVTRLNHVSQLSQALTNKVEQLEALVSCGYAAVNRRVPDSRPSPWQVLSITVVQIWTESTMATLNVLAEGVLQMPLKVASRFSDAHADYEDDMDEFNRMMAIAPSDDGELMSEFNAMMGEEEYIGPTPENETVPSIELPPDAGSVPLELGDDIDRGSRASDLLRSLAGL
jgi:hypothetical protein